MAATDTAMHGREPLSASELERLVDLLGVLPAGRRWAVVHMHGPLLCALGLVGAPDPGYQRAVLRRFKDPADARRRALALLDELDRDARDERYAHRRRGRRRVLPFGAPLDSAPSERADAGQLRR